MDEFFKMIDIFVMPSLSEGLPIALLEAMVHGKPCIASCVGGIPEVVTSSEVGHLVPPADYMAIVEAIILYAENSELRARVGAKGRELVCQRFCLQTMASDYSALYSQLLAVQPCA
jgi:glycosyltransferase involved in cell wall biosynthesis